MLQLDHLVLATPDLAATTAWFAAQTGVEPTPGGQHVGLGTRNMLVALSESAYLEIVGPDLDQDEPAGARPFGVDDLTEARLVTFAAKADNLTGHVDRCREAGLNLGNALEMSRAKPDGTLLEWSLTIAPWTQPVSLVPFLIDWRGAPSPALTSAQGVTLASLEAQHPDPGTVSSQLETIGVDLPVAEGTAVELVATIATPSGEVVVR